jgi:hypothetical protein
MLLLVTSCAHSPPSTLQTQLAARFASAPTKYRCPVNPRGEGSMVKENCVDDDGETWTACAWNGCGFDLDCRVKSWQFADSTNCGGPEWPECK